MRDTNMRFESLYKCSSSSTSPPRKQKRERERERERKELSVSSNRNQNAVVLSTILCILSSHEFLSFSRVVTCNLIQSRAEIELFRVRR
ncbi:hypothetical protein Bca101_007784 [Brassica carinata]